MRASSILVLVTIFPIIIASTSKVQDEGRKQEATPFFSQGVKGNVDEEDTMAVVQSWQGDLEQETTSKIDFRVRKRSLESSDFQPSITIIEREPSRKAYNTISNPKGTPWCGGNPTYWIVGHQANEAPFCFVNGVWEVNETSGMDNENVKTEIDRHACVTMDVNKDGMEDIICGVGGGKGKGQGHNELFITQKNGTLAKMPDGHGLDKHVTMSNRYAVVLNKDEQEQELVFFVTTGRERKDGRSNAHRMYRNVFKEEGNLPYFEEVEGPWLQGSTAPFCAVSGDFTHDQFDDIIVCDKNGPPHFFRQVRNDTGTYFEKVDLPISSYVHEWRNVRLANITGGALNDLVVVTIGQPSNLFIFQGRHGYPYFRFDEVYFETTFEWGSPDFAILDINNDNITDIYVIQMSRKMGTYCESEHTVWWGGALYPPDNYTPPLDEAHDVLLLGNGNNTRYSRVEMHHELPGCGFIAQRWDDNTMLLGQGDWGHVGYSLLLQWRFSSPTLYTPNLNTPNLNTPNLNTLNLNTPDLNTGVGGMKFSFLLLFVLFIFMTLSFGTHRLYLYYSGLNNFLIRDRTEVNNLLGSEHVNDDVVQEICVASEIGLRRLPGRNKSVERRHTAGVMGEMG